MDETSGNKRLTPVPPMAAQLRARPNRGALPPALDARVQKLIKDCRIMPAPKRPLPRRKVR